MLPAYLFRALLHIPHLASAAAHISILGRDPYRLCLAILSLISIIGAVLCTQATLRRLTRDPVYSFWSAFLVLYMAHLLLNSTWGLGFIVPYDVPGLFFFSLGMYLALTQRFWIFYAIFPLAVLNRETAAMLTVFFAIAEWVHLKDQGHPPSSRGRRVMPHIAAQAVIWVAIKLYLAHRFAHNPVEDGSAAGGLFVLKLGHNLRELAKPQQWPLFASVCGFSLPFLYLQRRWIQNEVLAYSCAIILPLSFVALLLAGELVEVRIFTEWCALAAPAVALILYHRFENPRAAHNNQAV